MSPLQATQRLPYHKPALTAGRAIEAVMKQTEKQIDYSRYYVDRIWLTQGKDEQAGTWVVSICPDPASRIPGEGWLFFRVRMDGTVQSVQGAIGPMLEQGKADEIK